MRHPCYHNYLIDGSDTFDDVTSELLLETLLSWLLPGLYTYPPHARNAGLTAKCVATGFPELLFPVGLPFGDVWSKNNTIK